MTTVRELIAALQALPPDALHLPVVCHEEAWIPDVCFPRFGYRSVDGFERDTPSEGERVIILDGD